MTKRIFSFALALICLCSLTPAALGTQKCAAPEISCVLELYDGDNVPRYLITVTCPTPGATLDIIINGCTSEPKKSPYSTEGYPMSDIGVYMEVTASAPGYLDSETVILSRPSLRLELCEPLQELYPARSASQFRDVPTNAWYRSDLDRLVKAGSINGRTSTTFAPDGAMTVAEYMKLLVTSLFGDELDAFTPTALGDSLLWYHKYLNAARTRCLDDGVDTSEEHLGEPINRYEMAQMLANASRQVEYDGFPITDGIETLIPDYADIPETYRDAVRLAYSNGLLGGVNGGAFVGDRNLKRCEACATIVRLFDKSARLPVPTPVDAQDYVGIWSWTGELILDGPDQIPPSKSLEIFSVSGSDVRFSYSCIASLWLMASTFNDVDKSDVVHGTLSGNVITARVMDNWFTVYDITITLLGDTAEVDVTEVELPGHRRHMLSDAILTRK